MLKNTLSHFFKAPRSTSNRLANRMNRDYRPTLEMLERRDAPAGVVTTLQTGTTLTITGVDDTTKAGILAGVNNNAITVVGGLAGDVNISGDLALSSAARPASPGSRTSVSTWALATMLS
jgi:hypothetical protein